MKDNYKLKVNILQKNLLQTTPRSSFNEIMKKLSHFQQTIKMKGLSNPDLEPFVHYINNNMSGLLNSAQIRHSATLFAPKH